MTPRPPHAPHHWPDRLFVAIAVVIAYAGWWILVHDVDGDHTGLELALVFGAFVGLTLASTLLRCVTQPGGFASTVTALQTRRGQGSSRSGSAALAWPRRNVWWVPWLLLPLFALALPVAFHESPGDASIVGVMFFLALVVGYAGVLAGTIVWMLLLLPVAVLVRAGYVAVRRRPFDAGLRSAAVVSVLLLAIIVLAVGLVLPRPPRGDSSGTYADRPGQIAAFFGAGDQSSPWLWVARGALLVVIGCVVLLSRGARRRPDESTSR